MEIHSLSEIPIAQIAEVFNKAFEGYFLPIQLTEQQMADKIKSENIKLELSVGATINDKLAGFILTGIDVDHHKTISYNAGTGVIPEFRGLQLTEKMYGYLLPLLQKKNIRKHQLEVITQNLKALTIYQKIGYQISKTVTCFKGKVALPEKASSYEIVGIDLPHDSLVSSFWNHTPTYQNTLSSINRNKTLHATLGIFVNKHLIGYITYAKGTGRIKQFGVHPNYRNNGIGHLLFYAVQQANPDSDLVLINIGNTDDITHSFLTKIGLAPIIEQFEMVLQN